MNIFIQVFQLQLCLVGGRGLSYIYIGKDGTRFVHSYFFLKGLGFLGVKSLSTEFQLYPDGQFKYIGGETKVLHQWCNG